MWCVDFDRLSALLLFYCVNSVDLLNRFFVIGLLWFAVCGWLCI